MNLIKLKPVPGLSFLSEENGKPCHKHMLNGSEIPGCTSISGLFTDDGWKFAWPVKLMEQIVVKEVNYCIDTQADEGLCKGQIEPICVKAKNAWRKKRDRSADIGTLAHGYIEDWIKAGKRIPSSAKPEVKNPFNQFIKWEGQFLPEWLACELHVGSAIHRFGGILDSLARIKGLIYLIDLKTSSGIKDEYSIQLAGLCIALEEMGLVVDRRAILHLPKEGEFEFRIIDTDLEQDKRAFLAGLNFYGHKNLFLARGKRK